MPISLQSLARQLYVHDGDVETCLEMIGEDYDPAAVPDVLGAEVRMMLDTRDFVRSMPEGYSAAALADWREEHGIRKPGDALHAPTGYTGPSGDPWAGR